MLSSRVRVTLRAFQALLNDDIYIKLKILGAGAVGPYAKCAASLKRLKNECGNSAAVLHTYAYNRGMVLDNSEPGGFWQAAQYKSWQEELSTG